MSKTEEYRAKAADCEKKAAEATDVQAKRLLQEAAKVWRDMAANHTRTGGKIPERSMSALGQEPTS